MRHRVPNLFIVGAAKSGTTTLFRHLSAHPDIYMTEKKEPNFFATDIDHETFCVHGGKQRSSYSEYIDNNLDPDEKREWDAYLGLFEMAGDEKVVGEGSVRYLYSPDAAENIYNSFPDARIVIMLRNPVMRAFSHYRVYKRWGYSESKNILRDSSVLEEFKEYKENKGTEHEKNMYFELSLYSKQVRRYLDLFPPENVWIGMYEDYAANFENAAREVFSFLGLDDTVELACGTHSLKGRTPRFNAANRIMYKTHLKPILRRALPQSVVKALMSVYYKSDKKIPETDERALTEFYVDDVRNLSELIGRDRCKRWLDL